MYINIYIYPIYVCFVFPEIILYCFPFVIIFPFLKQSAERVSGFTCVSSLNAGKETQFSCWFENGSNFTTLYIQKNKQKQTNNV